MQVDNLFPADMDPELAKLRKYYQDRDPSFEERLAVAELIATMVDARRQAGLSKEEVAERMGVPIEEITREQAQTASIN